MKIVFIFAAITVAANLFFLWYAKKKRHATKADKSSHAKACSKANSKFFFDTDEGKQLKQSAADELGISVEELDRMSVEEITHLAKKKELI